MAASPDGDAAPTPATQLRLSADEHARLRRQQSRRRALVAYAFLLPNAIFFVAFLPQFLHPASPAAPQLWALGITFVVLAALNATLYAAFASAARRMLESPRAQRRFNLLGGSLICAAGAWALLAKRQAQ